MKTPITWYGGKQQMLQHILPVIPEHTLYCEAFFGGGAVYFSKLPSKAEVINDVNKEAVNFYRVAVTNHGLLHREITTTLHSRTAYDDAKVVYQHPHLFNPVKRAWSFYTMANQSFSANLSTWGFDRQGSCTKRLVNKRLNFTEALKERLANTTIECDDALRVIARYDSDNTFHYVDPPYFNSDCGHYAGYSRRDFERLLELLTTIKGRFLLSSYPSDLLADFSKANGWVTEKFEKPVAVSKRVSKSKIEVLTANYPLTEYRSIAVKSPL